MIARPSLNPRAPKGKTLLTWSLALLAAHVSLPTQAEIRAPMRRTVLDAVDFGMDTMGDSLGTDGTTLAVACKEAGTGLDKVRVFLRDFGGAGHWHPTAYLAPENTPDFGFVTAIAVEDDIVAVGDMFDNQGGANAGAVYIFQRGRSPGQAPWRLAIKHLGTVANGQFGFRLSLDQGLLAVSCNQTDAVRLYRRNKGGADQWGLDRTLNPAVSGDWQGADVAVCGERLVIGTPLLDGLRVHERNRGGEDNWGLRKVLAGSDTAPGDDLGYAVAIHGDRIVAGAYRANGMQGAAYLFGRNQGGSENWGQVRKLAPSGTPGASPEFGRSVDLFGDTVLVGSPVDTEGGAGAGALYLFRRNEGGPEQWGRSDKLVGSQGNLASPLGLGFWSPALTEDLVVDAGLDNGRYATVFQEYPCPETSGQQTTWGADLGMPAGAHFGVATAIDGDSLFVGSLDANGVTHFRRNTGGGNAWGVAGTVALGGTGRGASLALDQGVLAVGAPGELSLTEGTRGMVYLYERNTGGADQWGQLATLSVPDTTTASTTGAFGSRVALQGDLVAVSAPYDDTTGPQNGGVHLFQRHRGGVNAWGLVKRLDVPDSPDVPYGFRFGKSLALDGDWLAVGSDVWVTLPGLIVGVVYLFHRNEGGANQWGFVRRIEYARPIIGHAHYSSLDGDFGDEVDLDNGLLAVSAPRELVASIDRIGAVYLYARDQDGPGQWGQVAKLTSNDDTCDQFATAINLEGDRLVVANPLSRVPPIVHTNNGFLRTYRRHQGGTDQWGEENAVPFNIQYFLSGQIAMRNGWVAVGDPGVFFNQANDGAVAVIELDRCAWVTTTNDTVNAGDGLTSLREAVTQANLGSNLDRAVFLLEGTYTLARPGIEENANATGDLDVTNTTNTVTLHGFGARNTVIDANGIDRLLHVQAGASLNLQGLTLTGGRAPNGPFNVDGKYGGGILNAGVLTLKDCTLHGNRAGNGGNDDPGEAGFFPGGDGGGGGGIANTGGTLSLTRCTVSNNRAGAAGAGIPDGLPGDGGGVYNNGTLTVANCTFHGNEAGAETLTGGVDGNGGGLFITTTGGAMVRQSTFTQNRAGDATGGVKGDGGGICVVNSSIALSNTILAGNSGGVNAVNGFGTFASPAHNLLGTAAGFLMTGTPTGNITNVSAQLGALQDNGGPTDTCLPGATSPAIDTGSAAVGDAVFSDQRGVTRLAPNEPMDIGAVETTGDFDGDGIPDAYEIANGLNYQEPADAPVDYDGDTVANLGEYTTGTGPNDAGSVFRVAAVAIPDGVAIRFPSLTGRNYTLQRSTTGPAGPFANVAPAVNIPGTGGILVIPQTPNAPTAFYQVRVSLSP